MPGTPQRSLSPRQTQIANLVRNGKTSRQIGEELFIDPRTVDSHIDAICNKLGVRTRVELVVALFGETDASVAPEPTLVELRANVPLQRTPLIGREHEVADIVRELEKTRLLTLTAAGGVGKSRIALAVAEALVHSTKEGVWLVDLAPLAKGSFVVATVAEVLKVNESPDRPLIETLAAFLKKRNLVLILDNCEHVIRELAILADALLRDCPTVRILATSREALNIAGEQTYRLPSLGVPEADELINLNAEEAANYPAVLLFAERAKAADRGFALGDDNAPAIADICYRLDGIPLAIELAAARVNTLPVRSLSARLDQRLQILSGGDRTALPRHRTMRALIDWSYDLLEPKEQRLFERLSIFAGGCTMETIAAVCANEPDDELNTLDVVSSLVGKSLVVADFTLLEPRYRLLESTRHYAFEKLRQRNEYDTIALRHAQWFAAFADELAELNWVLPRRGWLAKAVPELNNARAALTWALGSGSAFVAAARIAAGFEPYWFDRGLAGEGRRWFESVLERLDETVNLELNARVWLGLGQLLTGSRRVQAAERASRVFKATGNKRLLALGYLTLAFAHHSLAEYADAVATSESAQMLLQETGNDRSLHYGAATGYRALALVGLGWYGEARLLFEESIALLRSLGDIDRAALGQLNLAELERALGNLPRALELVEEALGVLRIDATRSDGVDNFFLTAASLNASSYLLVLGEVARARTAVSEAVMLARSVQVPIYTAIAVQHAATIAALQDHERIAARLKGFADAVYRNEGSRREPTEQKTYEILVTTLKAKLSEADITRMGAEGMLMTEEDAIARSLDVLKPAQ